MIFIDTGHGRKSDRYDPGAPPSATEPHQTEAVIVRHLSAALSAVLHRRGVAHDLVPDLGDYSVRHRWVWDRVIDLPKEEMHLYAQLHCNAGGGSYALAEHDARSRRGGTAAAVLADRLGPLVGGGQVRALGPDSRGITCLRGIWDVPRCCGVILEPGFLDTPDHDRLWLGPGISELARVLADALPAALAAR